MMMHAGEVARSGLAHTQQAARPPRKSSRVEFGAKSSKLLLQSQHLKTAGFRANGGSARDGENGREPGRPPYWSHINQPRPSDIISATTALTRYLVGRLSGVPRRFLFLFALPCSWRHLAGVRPSGGPSGRPFGVVCGGVPHPCF